MDPGKSQLSVQIFTFSMLFLVSSPIINPVMSGVPKPRLFQVSIFQRTNLISCLQSHDYMGQERTWRSPNCLYGHNQSSFLVLISPLCMLLSTWASESWAFWVYRASCYLLKSFLSYRCPSVASHFLSHNCKSSFYFPSFKNLLNFLGLLLSPCLFSLPPFGLFMF